MTPSAAGFNVPVLLIVALRLQQVVEGQLGGAQGELQLLDAVLRVLGVNAEEQVPLIHYLPLLKRRLQHFAADQGGGLIGVQRLNGACAGDGYRHVPHLGHIRKYVPATICVPALMRGREGTQSGPR